MKRKVFYFSFDDVSEEKKNQEQKIDFLAKEIYKNASFGRTLYKIKLDISTSVAIGHLLIKKNELMSYDFSNNGFPVYFNSDGEEFVVLKKTNYRSKKMYKDSGFNHNVVGAYFYLVNPKRKGFFVYLDESFLRIKGEI